jgi:hypothetical protein
MREADRFQRCQLCGGYIDVFDLAWSGSSSIGCAVDQRRPCVRWFGAAGADYWRAQRALPASAEATSVLQGFSVRGGQVPKHRLFLPISIAVAT